MQQEMQARRQELLGKERSLEQAEAAAERRWAKLTEDVSTKVTPHFSSPPRVFCMFTSHCYSVLHPSACLLLSCC